MTNVWCSRRGPDCLHTCEVDDDELTGDGDGDPSLLPVLAPADGWINDPDGDGLICGNCASPDEIAEWMADLALVEADDPLGMN
jgi:hypothetical protein